MKFYAAINIKENGKYYAFVEPFSDSDNALAKLYHKNMTSVNVYSTKKKAAEIASFWNDCYRKNGTYLFDNPKF